MEQKNQAKGAEKCPKKRWYSNLLEDEKQKINKRRHEANRQKKSLQKQTEQQIG